MTYEPILNQTGETVGIAYVSNSGVNSIVPLDPANRHYQLFKQDYETENPDASFESDFLSQ